MILDRLPEVQKLSAKDKLKLAEELWLSSEELG